MDWKKVGPKAVTMGVHSAHKSVSDLAARLALPWAVRMVDMWATRLAQQVVEPKADCWESQWVAPTGAQMAARWAPWWAEKRADWSVASRAGPKANPWVFQMETNWVWTMIVLWWVGPTVPC